MLEYTILFLLAVRALADAPCCEEKVRATSYLDVASDLISKARNSIPDCQDKKECPEIKATDCADWYKRGHKKSGLYNIHPINRLTSNKSLTVFCDMDTDGGGWTVIQRRGDFGRPDDYFYKDWASYKTGFGDVDKDFWLGNDNMFALTNQKPCSIRFDLQDKDLKKAYAVYTEFWIDDDSNKYMIHIANYSGNAGDSMSIHNNYNFTTMDRHNDASSKSCAVQFKSAWWYRDCHSVDLNGLYNTTEGGIVWYDWRGIKPLRWTEMKIRPKMLTASFLHEKQ